MTTPSQPMFPDDICMFIAPRVLDERSAILSINPVLGVFIERFRGRHQRFSDCLYDRNECRASLQHLRAERRDRRAELLDQLLLAWENIPSVGTSFRRRKSREQVREERLALCPGGRPTDRLANVRLVRIGNEMLRYLTGDSPLARAWPVEHLDDLQRAITALEASDQPVRAARNAAREAFLALHEQRLLWALDFVLLRDTTLRLIEKGLLADRLAAQFSDRTAERPATTRKKAAQAEKERLEKEREEREELEDEPGEEEETAT